MLQLAHSLRRGIRKADGLSSKREVKRAEWQEQTRKSEGEVREVGKRQKVRLR